MSNITPRSIDIFEMVISGVKFYDIYSAFGVSYQTVITECERVVKTLTSHFNLKDVPVHPVPGLLTYRADRAYWDKYIYHFAIDFKREYKAPDKFFKQKTGFTIALKIIAGMSIYDSVRPSGISDACGIKYVRGFTNTVMNTNKSVSKAEKERYRVTGFTKLREDKEYWILMFANYMQNNPSFIPLFGKPAETYIAEKILEYRPTSPKKRARYVRPK